MISVKGRVVAIEVFAVEMILSNSQRITEISNLRQVLKHTFFETLTTVFFEYTRNAILNIINNELGTCFTDVIFITDGSIDIDKEVALCGNI